MLRSPQNPFHFCIISFWLDVVTLDAALGPIWVDSL